MPRRKKTNKKVVWEKADDIKEHIEYLVKKADVSWVSLSAIHTVRSYNTQTRAYARIWGLPRIWQLSLNLPPSYTIEVISEKFDKLTPKQKDEVLMHELAHIPKNFSGALVAHTKKGKGNFHEKLHDMLKVLNSKK